MLTFAQYMEAQLFKNHPKMEIPHRLPQIPFDAEDQEVYQYAKDHGIKGGSAIAQRYDLLGGKSSPEYADMDFRARGRGTIHLPDVHVQMQHLRKKVKKLGYDPKKPIEFDPNSIERVMRNSGRNISMYPRGMWFARVVNRNDELYDQHKDEVERDVAIVAAKIIKQYRWAAKYLQFMKAAAINKVRQHAGGTLPGGLTIADQHFRMNYAKAGAWNYLKSMVQNTELPGTPSPHPSLDEPNDI